MKPIEPAAAVRPATRLERRHAETAKPVAAPPQPAAARVNAAGGETPATPPVEAERIAEIRKAIDRGTYPIVPTRIADAMIAAGYLLRKGK